MKTHIDSVAQYIEHLPDDRKEAIEKLRECFRTHLPKGFNEVISYGMIGYVVPHSTYPKGYHCDPKLPLPFINIASQKNFIAIYHMGIYSDKDLLEWFTSEYPKHAKSKLDMGKSCIRFKKMNDIPYKLLEELAEKIDVNSWIATYESVLNRK